MNYLLKKNYVLCFAALAFCACDKESIELEETVQQPTTTMVKSVANLTIDAGMTTSEINAVLNAAQDGDVVNVESATYAITSKLNLKSDITLQYSGNGTKPVFTAVSGRTELLEMYYSGGLNNLSITGIEFHNIRLKFADATQLNFENCTFRNGIRKPGTDKKYLKDAYIEFLRVGNSVINNCKFYREINNSGRGVYNKKSNNIRITNNIFDGYFTTAINENSINTRIEGNQISRVVNWVNNAETDHGVYAHTFTDLVIHNNTISGWPASSCGGALKVRNGRNLEITNNHMTTSGVLLYVYDHATHPFLENVLVKDNTIDIAYPGSSLYYGIGYWRNTTNGSESSIQIRNNILPNGSIKIQFSSLNTANFNANGGGVFDNDFGAVYLKAGINQSGNY